MKTWKMLAALTIALLGSQALAENWVAVITDSDGFSTRVDKDSIRRGSDGLAYYTVNDEFTGIKKDDAADCQRRVLYEINLYAPWGHSEIPNWRQKGTAAKLDSSAEAAFKYACSNAG